MKRRSSLRWLGLASAALTGTTVHAQARMRWNLAVAFGRGLELQVATAEDFARRVSELTGGKFQIAVDTESLRGNGLGAADAAQAGRFEMIHLQPGDCYSKDEVFSLGGDVPFGLNSRSMSAWYYQGNGLKLMRAFHAERGLVNFPLGNAGAQMGGWFKRQFQTPSELAGLKVRIDGAIASQILQRLGASPQSLAAGDVLAALERGVLDGAELFAPYDDFKLGVHRVIPNYCYPSWGRGGTQLELWVNRRAFEALPSEYRAAVEASAWAAHVGMQAKYDGLNVQALKQLVASGAKLFRSPKAIMDLAFKESLALCSEISQRNPSWRRIYDDFSNFRRDQNLWLRFAEAGFDDFMQAQRL